MVTVLPMAGGWTLERHELYLKSLWTCTCGYLLQPKIIQLDFSDPSGRSGWTQHWERFHGHIQAFLERGTRPVLAVWWPLSKALSPGSGRDKRGGSFQRSVGPQDPWRNLALRKTERNNSNIAWDYMGLWSSDSCNLKTNNLMVKGETERATWTNAIVFPLYQCSSKIKQWVQ